MLINEMVSDEWIPEGTNKGFAEAPRSKRRKVEICELHTLPPKTIFSGTDIVPSNANYNQ